MNPELRPEWTMDHPTTIAIDPRLLELDKNNRARINPDLIEASGGDGCPAGVWQETQSHANREELYQLDSEPSDHYTPMTGPLSSSDNDTPMYNGEESPDPSVNLSEAQKDNLFENRIFQSFVQTARGTPQAPSPGVEDAPQSLNAKGNGPLTLDHPVIEGYLESVPHLQHIIEYIINAEWYKKRLQEPPGEKLPGELGLQPRQSSTTPMSPFGEFFSANQPYDCLLCSKEARRQKRSLERALGHSRDHFKFKPIESNRKTYTNLNTKKDQERRAINPAKFCIPCGYKKITVQNCQRHVQSKAHKNLAASYPGDVWSNTIQETS